MIHGQSLTVGVAGYLLGTGVNPMGTTQRFGYGADHVLEYTLVLADGSIAKVNNYNTTILRQKEGCYGNSHDFLYEDVPQPVSHQEHVADPVSNYINEVVRRQSNRRSK